MMCSAVTNYIVLLQAQSELRKAQADFDRQAEITKLLLEGVRWVQKILKMM